MQNVCLKLIIYIIVCTMISSCDFNFLKEHYGKINGEIQYEDGTPVQDLAVFYGEFVYNIGHPASLIAVQRDTSDTNGKFHFKDVESLTTYSLKISNLPEGYQSSPESFSIKLDHEETIEVQFVLVPDE